MFDIVTALYNKEPFIGATVASVIAQRFTDWRLFVVDDGSHDKGPEIVESFRDPRITLIRQKNRGVGPARNAGIAAGSSKLIAFLDADDVWNGDHLEELAALHDEFPGASLLGCDFTRFAVEPALRDRSLGGGARQLSRYFWECARGQQLFFTSSVGACRSAIASVGDFKPLPGNEDVELWARLALHGPVAVSSKRTVHYRVGTGGLTDLRTSEGDKPLRREDLSSTIPTLTERLPHIADAALRRDVIEYMDSRIGIRMVAAVLEGDFGYARQLLSLYERRPRGKALIAAIIAKVPNWLAGGIVRVHRRLKAKMGS